MCGRTACTLNPDILCKACAYRDRKGTYHPAEWRESPNGREYKKCANLSPSMYSPILVSKKTFDSNAAAEEHIIQPMMWGLIPPWHKGTPTKHGLTTNNCRLEGITEKKLYREPLNKGNRCVVLCDGFYEWKAEKNGTKQPYFIHFPQPDGIAIEVPETWENNLEHYWSEENGWCGPKPLAMAGIFDTWRSMEDGSLIYSYSVVTMESSSAVSWIHERMPAILNTEEDVCAWLDSSNVPVQKALSMLKPSTKLKTHPVSTLVNTIKNQDLKLSQEVDLTTPKPLTASGKFMASWLSRASPVKKEQTDSSEAELSTGDKPKHISVKRELETDMNNTAKRFQQEPPGHT